MEQLLVPYTATHKIEASKVLVLAPHPDDEVFGCGGAIMRHIAAGDSLRVCIVTNGEYRAENVEQQSIYSKIRQEESYNAAAILGYGKPEFWGQPDRSLEYGEFLVQRIESAITELGADLVYAPSIYEMHPDHRALGMAALEAVRRQDSSLKLAMYEIGVPLTRPNLLLDITNLRERKQNAMACFVSQLQEQPYDEHIGALNRFRTYTLGSEVTAAEAYFVAQADELKNDIFGLYESEHQRQQKMGLPMMPADLPLVSVLIRSMDRPTLRAALDSVALQTYSNIEVVVINAMGEGHSALGALCGRFPMRLAAGDGPLERSRAANLGMETARGAYLIFLDDDDLFLPEHLTKLTKALLIGKKRVAYTGVKVVDKDDATILILDEPWDVTRLRGANYLPIHAVLFDRSLLALGCRFNETLDCLEDWEFWLQVSQHTTFHHIPGVSAVYRIAFGTSGLSIEADAEKHIVNRAAIFEMWMPHFTSREWVQSIYWFEMARNHFMTVAAGRLDENNRLSEKLDELKYTLVDTNKRLAETYGQLTEKTSRLAKATAQLIENREQIAQLEITALSSATQATQIGETVQALIHSTSWKITAPLRFISRLLHGQHSQAFDGVRRRIHPLGRSIYYRLPPTWRGPLVEMSYRMGGRLFSGLGHYEVWRQRSRDFKVHFPQPPKDSLSRIVDISDIPPLNQMPPGRIAIHAHIFYSDLVPEFEILLRNMPFPYDLFVSVPSEGVCHVCKRAFEKLPYLNQIKLAVVPNRGRDIAPMFCEFGKTLRSYDYVAHIHGKKSLYNKGATTGWREYLLKNLIGSEQQIKRIFALLTESNGFGFVYPQNFAQLPYQANTWLSNRSMGRYLCKRIGIQNIPQGYFDFPAGSMFWARMDALRPLFDAEFRLEDFPEECGQKDATVAHCLERLFVLTTNQTGFKAAILRDDTNLRWSSWGLEQYLCRSRVHMESAISATEVRVVVFDIFDTLLLRPFLDPESIKTIVAKQAGGEIGIAYLEFRAKSESLAREQAGRDVGLDAIFAEFSLQSKLPVDIIAKLRRLEETAELNAVTLRPDAVAMLQYALSQSKKVVLASDMYLPKSVVEAMLMEHGINNWHTLYLSSDIGLRKDSGALYKHILVQEGVTPDQVLVIGDNEHSDVQIPGDMGMNICHVLRPVELARAIPRLGPLVDRALLANDLNEQLTLGLIAKTNFHPIFYPQFDPFALVPPHPAAIGYSVLGPMVLSFVQWLSRTAAESGLNRLYFLSREGQFLKMVYDHWTAHDTETPQSEYLVLSRRAVTVPMIADINDIYAIAQPHYFPNKVSNFIKERFGLELSNDEWMTIWTDGLWREDRLVEVIDGQIDHLKPLLLALESRILVQSNNERPGILTYLDKMGLNKEGKFAVVDVGYAATIQGRLNRLLNRKVHGYYMVTDQRAQAVSQEHEVVTQGCFGHHVSTGADAPKLLVKSFTLEKLLSSDDAQIVQYKTGKSDETCSEFRILSSEEFQTRALRAEIRKGALEFVSNAIAVRTKLVEDFIVPPKQARAIYEAFIEFPAASEEAILAKLVLDDHYCGRGLVS